MNQLRKVSFERALNLAKVLAHGRPKCLKLVRNLLSGKSGIEIGGPSAVFRQIYRLPIYDYFMSLDNCDFSQNNTWATHKQVYCFSKRRPCGKTYFSEGSVLPFIADNTYDFLLSSHNLEHMANPIKALKEWQRVVKTGGHLVIVLPHYLRTFDHCRVPTTIQHMLGDYERNTDENDLTHFDEVYEASRLYDRERSDEETRSLLLNNFNHRMMHHHVFNEVNSKELLEAAGLEVLAVEMQLPCHIFLVAQNP
jgi:SAM-dependent methyltransferase